MKVTITSIELKSIFKLFSLYSYSFQIMNQLKTSNCVSYKIQGIWKKHYTITLWKSQEDISDFARTGAHLTAMKSSKKIAKEIRTITIEKDKIPSWGEAKKLLNEKGKIFRLLK